MPVLIFLLILSPDSNSQYWKEYPYEPQGSLLSFPGDEGFHPAESIEWWYINGHVTGQVTGDEYTFMLSYFYEPVSIFDGFRIFNLSNETTKEFYDETLPCMYVSVAEDSLNIIATVGFPSSHYEEWVTQTDMNGTMEPFQYHLSAISGIGSIDINCNTLKRPLIVADSGYLYQGASGYTYYYSQTMMDISGIISFNSTTENISGTGWIDRQFGSYNPNDGEEYEWLCIQLNNGMDFNIWNIFTEMNEIPYNSAYRICSVYINDSSSFTTSEFDVERQEYSYTQDSARCYSQQWRLLMDTFNVDLVISTQNPDNEIELPFRFFEGSTLVQGNVKGLAVGGAGFTELLHSYEKPDVEIVYPNTTDIWDGSGDIRWRLNNPDQGNPVIYDIDISTDDRNTFNKIEGAISDTSYYWNPSSFIEDTVAWLRVTGYSADSTLVKSVVHEVKIKPQQKDYQLCTGDNLILIVKMNEEEEFSYQWQRNNEDIQGATDSIYSLDSATTEDIGSYECIVYNGDKRDTTISYNLVVKPVYETNVKISICDNDSIYIGGEWKKTDGIYYDSTISVFGCDSIVIINLSVDSLVKVNNYIEICDDDSIFLGGAWRNKNGIYTDTINSGLDCDTIYISELAVNSSYNIIVDTSICQGDSILVFGIIYKSPGTFVEELTSVSGCDSINTVNLSVEICGLFMKNTLNNNPRIITNSATKSIHIKFENYFNGYIEVFNLNGEILKIKQIQNSKEAVINIYDLDKGIYLLRFRSKAISGIKKIMMYSL